MSKEIVTTFDLEETMLARTRLLIQLMGHKLFFGFGSTV